MSTSVGSDFFSKYTQAKYIKIFVAAFAALVLVVGLFTSLNSAQKGITSREAALNAQYLDNQNELSTYVVSIKESLGVADRNTQALDQVLMDAVKGRYENKGAPDNGAMFSAMVEAYPDLSSVSIPYQKVQDAVLAGRTAYKNKQSKLLDMLREYDTWRKSGFIHSAVVNMVGAPSDNLVARVGANSWRGQDALDKMYQIVLTKDAQEAYESGEMKPMDLGPTPTAKP